MSSGVAANAALRDRFERLCAAKGVSLLCPPKDLCSDNGVMIAWAALEYAMTAGCAAPLQVSPLELIAARPPRELTC